MSHFKTINAGLTDKQALVTGLENLLKEKGIPAKVHVYEQPVSLMNGYQDYDESEETAEVIIKGRDIDSYSDVGFKKEGDQYRAIIDSYDFRSTKLNAFRTVDSFLKAVQEAHTQAYIQHHYPSDQWEMSIKQEGVKTITTLTKKVEVYI